MPVVSSLIALLPRFLNIYFFHFTPYIQQFHSPSSTPISFLSPSTSGPPLPFITPLTYLLNLTTSLHSAPPSPTPRSFHPLFFLHQIPFLHFCSSYTLFHSNSSTTSSPPLFHPSSSTPISFLSHSASGPPLPLITPLLSPKSHHFTPFCSTLSHSASDPPLPPLTPSTFSFLQPPKEDLQTETSPIRKKSLSLNFQTERDLPHN